MRDMINGARVLVKRLDTSYRRCIISDVHLALPPTRYAWASPAYDLIHASIAPCNADILRPLRGEAPAETIGHDNLWTAR